jgi:4-amino-4-deoxy-L-arabinose transferase-like glycosyltransferase
MPQRHFLVALLCLAWMLPGLIGHDPWKPDEAYSFGVVYEIVRGGSWITLSLAGEPYVRDPPLYYLTASLTAHAFSALLPLHDAARLASGFYIALALLFCALAARELNGRARGTLAVVLLLGSFGLMLRSHQLITEIAGFAGFAMAYYGCARALRGPAGGFWIGGGMGIVFLSQGLPEALIVALFAAVLPLVSRAWRTRGYAGALALALIAATPWFAVWPALLYAHAPAQFHDWLTYEAGTRLLNAGRGFYYLRILPWYAWPVWALALWSLWRGFGAGAARPAITLPLAGFVITLFALSEATERRELYALPLLIPLALLATPGVETLRRGAANAWYWFSLMAFTFFVIVAWVYWSGLELGWPTRLHAHLQRLRPAYEPGFRVLPFVFGALYTIAWFAVITKLPRSPERPAYVWAAGITVAWGLAGTLFVGWVDSGKTYRGMIASMVAAMPERHECVSSRGLGEAQRAMLHYFAGIITYREEVPTRRRECDLKLVQGVPGAERPPAGPWVRIWEGSRPRDRSERYWLYHRPPP